MTTTKAALEVRGLWFGYGPRAVLRDVSLSLGTSDCYGFLGHNGAGKTTVLRLCLSLLQPSKGSIEIHGIDARAFPREARALVGTLVERPGFHDPASALQNLVLLARLQGLDRRRAVVDAFRVLELLSLQAHAHRHVGTFSLGMRQRLGIAQALLGSPRLLLLDEPINGLDPEGIQEVRTLLQRLSREDGISILLSSHQLQELEGLCTRIGVLRDGAMVLEGSLDDLRRHGARRMLVEGADLVPLQRRLQQLGLAHERDGDRLWVEPGSMASGELARQLAAAGELTAFGKEPVSIESIYLAATKQNGDGREGLRAVANDRDVVEVSQALRAASPPLGAAIATLGAAVPPPRRRAFTHELRALFLRASTKWLVAAPISFAAISAFSYQGRVQRALAAVASKERFSADSGSGHLCALQALSSSLPVLLLCTVWLGSQSIAADLQRGTLRNTLVRSLARGDVLLGKVLALAAFAVVAYALLVGASIGLSAAMFGWSDLLEVTRNGDRQPLAQALDVAPVFQSAVLHSLPPLLAALTIALAASVVAKRSARALVLALACVLGPEFVHPFVRGYEGWLLTSHLPTPLRDDSVLRYATAIARGAADANWAYESTALTAPFSAAAAALLVAFLSFRRLRIP